MIAHWDDVASKRADAGPLRFDRYDLGEAAGSLTVGVTRARVDPGGHSSPVHVELDEEEIFYVLGGSGVSYQAAGDAPRAYDVGAGDCIVHLVGEEAHTLVAGPDGLDLLAFGERTNPTMTYLPRAGVVRSGVTLEVPDGPHPWEREAAAGALQIPAPSERPRTIVNVRDVGVLERRRTTVHSDWRDLGRAAGSLRTGLKHVVVSPERLMVPPHCHSAEEELFIVLEGEGTLELTPAPDLAARKGALAETHPVRAGSVVSRPAGTGIAHTFRAGASGMTVLAYGTRDPGDVAFYPRSNKLFFRGAGVIVRAENVDYWDGED